jgi:signal transduction histidine kinase
MTADLLHRLIPLLALGLNLVLLGSALTADRKSPRNRFFAWLVSALAVWNFGVLGLRSTADPVEALAWERFLHLGVIPIPVLFYHYVLLFLDVPRRRTSLILGYLLAGAFLVASPTSAFMTGVHATYWGFAPTVGPLYGPFFLYFQAYLVVGLVWLIRAYRSLRPSFRRNRTLLVIAGGAVSVLGGVVDFSRFIFGWERLYPAGIPTNAVFALALGVALVRYRLINLTTLARRSVLYLLTAIALAPILFAGVYAVDHFTPGPIAPGPHLETEIGYLLVLLLALTVALPLLGKLERLLDRVMFKRQHGVRDALVALSKEISSILEIRTLGQTLTEGLVARIPVMHATFHLHDEATNGFILFSGARSGAEEASIPTSLDRTVLQWLAATGKTFVVEEAVFQTLADPRLRAASARMEAARVALLLPLVLESELTAVLAVGEKLSGEGFDRDEIELLETLMEETAIALRNSRLYEDLRHQMEELRTTQEQLVQSAKLAALGELATSVAHEINNPLTAIMGAIQLLIRQMPSDSLALEQLKDMERVARRAVKISRQLLDVGRRREPKREPLALPEVIVRSLELLRPKLTSARIEVQTVLDADVPLMLGDRDELTQVFVNLFANAADSMAGGGTLVVRSERLQHEGRRYIGVTVADTGIGMDHEHLGRIFEPFYTTKPEGQGTGLGLSIARGIMVKHGGTIEAESKRGKGTTMMLRFPLSP